MITKYIILCSFSAISYGLSIGVSDKENVTESAGASDLFPDWVPFKNKHGDELGEFLPVKKNKVKKRLAPPINFILRAIEPEGDYYDKGGDAGSDSEDYFEKKHWSDLHRPAEPVDGNVVVNHTALSDIDGIVNIITQQSDHPLTNGGKPRKETQPVPDILSKDSPDEPVTEEPKTEPIPKVKTEKHEEEANEEDSAEQQKEKTEEERENEEKKAKILSSVDELKIRHAEEQRAISDRAREEELYKELFEKNANIPEEIKERPPRRKPNKVSPPDYEEYEDQASLEDKYKIKPIHRGTVPTTTTERQKTKRVKTNKHTEAGKLSVFKNPHLYMVYDDNDSEETTPVPYISSRGNMKFSSRYTTDTTPEEEERISLVPEDSKEGEPTLFLPKKRKNRRRKIKTTTPAPQLPKSVEETFKDTTAFDTTAADTKQSDVASVTAVDGTSEADTTVTDSLPDAVPAPSEHKKEEPKDYHNEKGGGKEHKSEHSEEHEEHGKKAYEVRTAPAKMRKWISESGAKFSKPKPWYLNNGGYHENTKTAKGHHDKEDHLGKYDDHGGLDKHHHHESEHYGDHHHEEHGKKHAKYEESGKHSKGHSTKGSHDIHKKEEYEKKVEFFEEEGDESDEEKHGGYNHETEHSKGGHFKKGNLKAGHREHSKGESGHFGKGGHSHSNKGHKLAAGHDSHGKHHHDHGHKDGKAGGKKWIYHHGYPAKTANLVVIDRRGDQYYHGPHYFG